MGYEYTGVRRHVVVACLLLLAADGTQLGQMNDVKYMISNGPSPKDSVRGFRGEFFEIYGPQIQSRYSEVHWRPALISLPDDIISRFDGKVMAVTGIETDIVRLGAKDGTDTSVPCYEQYNHHYSNFMHGKAATMVEKPRELNPGEELSTPMAMDGHLVTHPVWEFSTVGAHPGIPRVQAFSEGNGNEHAGSYKGYAQGFAQLIQSPIAFTEGPMIINTNKRLTNDSSPGHVNNQLLPRNSLAPSGAKYSGIAECPCTSRKAKILDNYTTLSAGACTSAVESVMECSAAFQKVTGRSPEGNVSEVHSDKMPHGCSASANVLTFNYGGEHVQNLCGVGGRTCVCRDPSCNSGTLAGHRFNGIAAYCAPYPKSELIKSHNDICDIRAYRGGLLCCSDQSLLLDADQEVPAAVDTWQMKYRFYFEEYTTQRNTFRVWWSTEATNNEYDVPKSTANCLDPATPKSECQHVIRSVFRGVDILSLGSGCMMQGDINACGNVTRIKEVDGGRFQLMYAGPHCHAPACAAMELWNEDTGELLCNVNPIYGDNNVECEMALPPCVWGSAAEGLKPPPVLYLDSNLTIVKYANNTNGHWGTMALWQMRAAYISDSGKLATFV